MTIPQPDLLAALFDDSPSAVVVVGEDGHVRVANEAAAGLLKVPLPDLPGSPITARLPGVDIAALVGTSWQLVTAVGGGGETFPADIHVATLPNTLDASAGRYLVHLQPFPYGDEALFAKAPDGILVLDDDRRYLAANPAACALFGMEPNRIIGASLAEIPTPQDRRTIDVFWERLMRAGNQVRPFRFERPDGSMVDLEYAARAHYRPGLHLVLLRNLSGRDETAAALRRTEQSLRDVIDCSPDTVGVHQNGHMVFANAAAFRMLGYHPKELGGVPITDLVHPDDLALSLHRTEFMLKTWKRAPVIELRLLRKDGTELRTEVVSAPIVYEGEPAVVVFVRDTTERQRLEARLRQAQKMEAIGRLAGGVAHDFNNILTGIIGSSQLALDSMDPDSVAAEDIREIIAIGERASELTHQLLTFSRRQPVQPDLVDLNRTIEQVGRILTRVLRDNVKLENELDPSLGLTLVDPIHVEQVILNLAVNAGEAMPDGGVLRLRTCNAAVDAAYADRHPGMEEGDYVRLTVSDTGKGMDPEEIEHLFEPFYTTKAVGEGSGLGLATSYGIIRQAGGTISVESTLGQGTTFEVLLPRVHGTPAPAGKSQPDNAILGGQETILIAEDEASVRHLLSRLLRRQGYTILTARNGGEALKIAQAYTDPIDLLLTDVIMPELSGLELAEQVREARPDLAVVYISGYSDTEPVIPDSADGGPPTDFLPKPFKLEDVARSVRRTLEQRQ